MLATKGARLDQAKRTGETALHVACVRGNDVACAFLLSAGCDVNRTTNDGTSALHFAILAEQAEIVKQVGEIVVFVFFFLNFCFSVPAP